MATPDERLLPSNESYRERALASLQTALAPLPEPRFWQVVEGLGWGRRTSDPAAAARELAQKTTLTERLQALARFHQLERDLERAFASWELRTQQEIGLGDELERDLREHLIGLGQAEYEAARRNPALAKQRADRDDYLESFGQAFQEATASATDAELDEVLRQVARAFDPAGLREGGVVLHPQHGLGVVREEPWAHRCRVTFPEGDLLVDKRPELLH
jgi:hypothetical protein